MSTNRRKADRAQGLALKPARIGREFSATAKPYRLISLLVKDFFLKEALDGGSHLKHRVAALEWPLSGHQASARLKEVILECATDDFRATLERNLTESERLFLSAFLEARFKKWDPNPLLPGESGGGESEAGSPPLAS